MVEEGPREYIIGHVVMDSKKMEAREKLVN